MNCREVARTLAVPSDGADPAELQRHLAVCGRCAAEVEAARRLDAAWAATRPAEPSPAVWDRTWAGVAAALEAPATIALRGPAAAGSGRRWLGSAVAVALIAQAAAVMLGIGLWLSRGGGQGKAAPADAIAQAQVEGRGQVVEFEVEPGSTLFLELDETGGRVVCRPRTVSTEELVTFDSEGVLPTEMASLADLQLLNAAEGLE